jgi:hypothetical protein
MGKKTKHKGCKPYKDKYSSNKTQQLSLNNPDLTKKVYIPKTKPLD